MKFWNTTIFGFFVLSLLVVFSSCDSNRDRSGKVRSIGNTSEILVVVENEHQWENSIGKVIKEYLGRSQYGLNQEEPIFDLAHIQKKSFNELFKKHRNIFIVEIDKTIGEPKIELHEDYWSKPQKIFKITAPDATSFKTVFAENAETFRLKYNQAERYRILTVFRTTSPNKVTKKVLKQFGLNITIPRDFYLAKTEKDFLWLRKEPEKFSQGIIMFAEPYMDTAQFSQASIVARINRFQQQFVPGAIEGSYMSTDAEYIPPRSEIIDDFLTDYAVETRGLWKVEGDFMSGPFVSYTFVEPNSNNIVTLMGYVYLPNKEKRDLLRQLEAILYSTQINS